jgi:hypothetical protein
VYKKIKIINYMRKSFLSKIEGATSANHQDKLLSIKEHFRDVSELEQRFHETVIQGNIQNIYFLALNNPVKLVKVLRIIENEEVTNASLVSKFKAKELEEQKLS